MFDDLERAERLARALLADLMQYGTDDQAAAVERARALFRGRVMPASYHVFERVLSDPAAAPFQVRAPAWGGGDLVVPKPFSSVTGLGSAVKVWPSKENVLLGPVIMTLAGAVCLTLTLALVLSAPLPAAIGPLLGGAMLSGFGIHNILRLRRGASAVVVYESGFAAAVGARIGAWPWREITSIVSSERFVSGRRRAGFTVRSYEVWKGDTSLVLDGDLLEDVRALVERIKERVGVLLLPSLQARYDAGQALAFGPVTVSREGIGEGSRELHWGEVREVVVKAGRLIVTPKDGPPLKVTVSRIPNIELLGMLIGVAPSSMDLAYL